MPSIIRHERLPVHTYTQHIYSRISKQARGQAAKQASKHSLRACACPSEFDSHSPPSPHPLHFNPFLSSFILVINSSVYASFNYSFAHPFSYLCFLTRRDSFFLMRACPCHALHSHITSACMHVCGWIDFPAHACLDFINSL